MIFDIVFIILLLAAGLCAWQIAHTDFRRRIIPDVYLFPLLLIGLTVTHFFPWPISTTDSLIAAISGYILTSITGFVFTKIKSDSATPPIGFGDIKLITVGGIWLGTNGLAIALAVACLGGLIWGISKKQKFVPFAPFFVFGGILSLIITTFLI